MSSYLPGRSTFSMQRLACLSILHTCSSLPGTGRCNHHQRCLLGPPSAQLEWNLWNTPGWLRGEPLSGRTEILVSKVAHRGSCLPGAGSPWMMLEEESRIPDSISMKWKSEAVNKGLASAESLEMSCRESRVSEQASDWSYKMRCGWNFPQLTHCDLTFSLSTSSFILKLAAAPRQNLSIFLILFSLNSDVLHSFLTADWKSSPPD